MLRAEYVGGWQLQFRTGGRSVVGCVDAGQGGLMQKLREDCLLGDSCDNALKGSVADEVGFGRQWCRGRRERARGFKCFDSAEDVFIVQSRPLLFFQRDGVESSRGGVWVCMSVADAGAADRQAGEKRGRIHMRCEADAGADAEAEAEADAVPIDEPKPSSVRNYGMGLDARERSTGKARAGGGAKGKGQRAKGKGQRAKGKSVHGMASMDAPKFGGKLGEARRGEARSRDPDSYFRGSL
ncbi:hypothetical protein VTL71DRAFT_6140 [Oculimacula yallundae]|uniref:Uncharacterized protein n=1 Tax=Oculimacula yallundae TaxID=86028 RepID=A0ABR4C232_9HELO